MAQFGRALRSGRRSRRFESCHLDQKSKEGACPLLLIFRLNFTDSEPLRSAGPNRFALSSTMAFRKQPAQNLVQNPVISTKKRKGQFTAFSFFSLKSTDVEPLKLRSNLTACAQGEKSVFANNRRTQRFMNHTLPQTATYRVLLRKTSLSSRP